MLLTPYVIEDTGRGEKRLMDIYSRLLKDWIIFIGTQIKIKKWQTSLLCSFYS